MNFHPAADVFPLMDGVTFSALVEDVKAHGLQEPIVLHEGRILDGRNRYRACEQAGVEPRYVQWAENGSTPTEWVVSMNLHRRHLTTAQRAALALDLLPRLEEEARERQERLGRTHGQPLSPETDEGATGRSDEKAAALVGVGRTAVATAKAIQKRHPKIINEMRAGGLNIAQAQRAAGLAADRHGEGSLAGNRDAMGRAMPSIYYGRGDKWTEATEPLRRYLKAWSGRDYSFTHVNPREARKRVEMIDGLIASLQFARADLAPRAHSYRLSVN